MNTKQKYNVTQDITKPNNTNYCVIDGELDAAGRAKVGVRFVQRGMKLEDAKQLAAELNANAKRWGG